MTWNLVLKQKKLVEILLYFGKNQKMSKTVKCFIREVYDARVQSEKYFKNVKINPRVGKIMLLLILI